jgi:serine phosphatase RsbU (regulator of sigma subunit)
MIAAPVQDVATGEPIGAIYLELFSLAQPWDRDSLARLFPAVQSLGAQIASAIRQVEIYHQSLAYQRVSQELALAGKIQSSFLPDELPTMPGWELAVSLLPARETSGDFFDLIPLADGKVGILIADVADKGVGAALYMALTRTLIRTYAIEFDDEEPQPEVVFFAVNGRILSDAHADLFVTAFYGVLDPATGILTYTNAGHNPPYLLRSHGEMSIDALPATGMPIGVEEDQLWERVSVALQPGESLVLYTDGVTDSQNCDGQFYESDRLLALLNEGMGKTAHELQDSILTAIHDWTLNAQQFDDITLMVLTRDPLIEPAPAPEN